MFYNYYFFAITQRVNPKDYFSNRPLRSITGFIFPIALNPDELHLCPYWDIYISILILKLPAKKSIPAT